MKRRLTCLLLCAVISSGCTAVAPWQRGNLAKPQMALGGDLALQSMRAHSYESREASTGSSVSNGGGCGCY